MSKRNSHDLTCAQEVFRINRDEVATPLVVVRSAQPRAVVRRSSSGVVTRVTPVPAGLVQQNKLNGAQLLRDEYLPRSR